MAKNNSLESSPKNSQVFRKRRPVKIGQKFWSEFFSPCRGNFWVEGKITQVWNRNLYELLYSDGDYVDQKFSELFLNPPASARYLLPLKK